jgi:spore germination protein KC
MVRNEMKETNITIPCNENNYTSLHITGQKVKSDVNMNKNQAQIHIKGTMFAILDETGCSINLEESNVLGQIEKDTEKAVEKMVSDSITTSQKYKSDVFGFGKMVDESDHQAWKRIENQWIDIFPNAKIKVDYSVKIRRIGTINGPVFYKE